MVLVALLCRSDYTAKTSRYDGKDAQHFAKKRLDLLQNIAAAAAQQPGAV
jgi:hypothetical protein